MASYVLISAQFPRIFSYLGLLTHSHLLLFMIPFIAIPFPYYIGRIRKFRSAPLSNTNSSLLTIILNLHVSLFLSQILASSFERSTFSSTWASYLQNNQTYTAMSSLITGYGSDANAGPAVIPGQGGIKAEVIDDFACTMSEGRDLSSMESDTTTVTRKEEAVGASVFFLNKAENIVAPHTDMFPEFKNWQDQAKQILGGLKRPRVLFGVLGYTGSGKSSLINALIDEEMVVPANAMRASTSVVTEISWNDSDDPGEAFRAEIEFISEIEWKMEIGRPIGRSEEFNEGRRSVYQDWHNKQVCAKGISYLPPVRCVRIYTKAEILRHGLVLVGLPGLGDSNTGRTQVAEKYAKNLNYVWIVADILRAIGDQVAKDLMGKSFRRQLLMDGKYDDKYVTFIMTKTDITNTEEVVESLQLRENDLRNVLAQEEKIIKEIHDGQEALGREIVKVKKMKRALRALEKSKPSKAGKAIPPDLETTDKKISKKKLLLIRKEIKAACTQARNNYTQEHLKMDFENGLREFKQDISDDLNDERPLGNEDDVESKNLVFCQGLVDQLHVFCVSSKGYQKLSGRFKRDRIPEGFTTVNDTFIPSLQEYAVASTLIARTKVNDAFLNEFNLLKLTIKSWAENDTPNSLSSSQKHALNARLEERIETLNKSFSHAFDTAMTRIRETIETNILSTLEGCIKASTEKAEQACRNLVNLDTSYQTWKAICQQIHKEYSGNVAIIINKFPIDVKPLLQDMSEASASNLPIEFLTKIPYLNGKITSAVSASLGSAQKQAREIHRLIEPLIKQHLQPAYESCSRESNIGALSHIGDMIMLAVAKDDETREEVRNTLRNDLKLELNILEAAWVRGASEPTDGLLSVMAEEKPFDEISEDDDNTEDPEDSDDSNISDEA
ncbi:3ebc6d55-2da4-45e6-985d-8108c33c4a1d [Sclerotinia trifoliorum]|uniref:3ebc6d55-2da4-45e6-985d-8108c33c4a1d n=1 Tax=Sclerotinia trifoliorum TaxID=28548 RepID=A0A8H2VWG8_9HELO|nr:3ebc6d55-2da4-45e6-985d-8108c33c4a1d [Sclerotinia trifoliorum]